MQINYYLKENPRKSFLISSHKDNLSIKKILKKINQSSLGFCVIKINSKYKIFTDGDFRRSIIKNTNFILGKSKLIMYKKIITVDLNETLYKAYRLMIDNSINCILITKKNKIFSYINLHEIIQVLSPERLNLEKKKLDKYNLDISKHLLRYFYSCNFISSKSIVLDAACGTGYGSYIMSKKAKKIFAIDFSKHAISFAKSNYKSKNIKFINKNIIDINFKKKFDVIVSLETLEHLTLKDALVWLRKCNYLLKKEGIFVCSSPLLRVRNNKPFITNPHHLHEMRRNEFFYYLKKIFNPKKINSYIQKEGNLIPLSNQNEGLSIVSLTK